MRTCRRLLDKAEADWLSSESQKLAARALRLDEEGFGRVLFVFCTIVALPGFLQVLQNGNLILASLAKLCFDLAGGLL